MRNAEILIVADDLSGAADCGVACAARGLRTVVVLDGDTDVRADAVAIDADTRRMTEAEAAAVTGRIFREHGAPVLYKKLDSMLRGHVAAELRAVVEATGKRVIAAPAYPAVGRITVDGVQHGVDLRYLLRGEPMVTVCDARSEEDLAEIVRRYAGDVVWAGSGGLARHLPMGRRDAPDVVVPRAKGPVLTVVGSRAEISVEQAARMDCSPDLSALAQGRDVLVRGDTSGELARLVAPYARLCGGLILTGGETARAVLEAMNIRALRLVCELQPGVPVSITEDSRAIPVVTKAGAFGNRDTLVACLHALQ